MRLCQECAVSRCSIMVEFSFSIIGVVYYCMCYESRNLPSLRKLIARSTDQRDNPFIFPYVLLHVPSYSENFNMRALSIESLMSPTLLSGTSLNLTHTLVSTLLIPCRGRNCGCFFTLTGYGGIATPSSRMPP